MYTFTTLLTTGILSPCTSQGSRVSVIEHCLSSHRGVTGLSKYWRLFVFILCLFAVYEQHLNKFCVVATTPFKTWFLLAPAWAGGCNSSYTTPGESSTSAEEVCWFLLHHVCEASWQGDAGQLGSLWHSNQAQHPSITWEEDCQIQESVPVSAWKLFQVW